MAITREKKEQVLAKLVDNFKSAKSAFFSHYKGTSVKDMSALRKQLREKQVPFIVAKKTLIQKAASENGLPEIPADVLEGPIGVAFGVEDPIAPAREIHSFAKGHETIGLTGAIFESKILSKSEAKEIATLPSREELLAKLVGMLQAPIAGFQGVLHGVIRGFVYALSEVSKKQPAPAAAAESVPEAAPAEAPAAEQPAAA